MSISSNITTEKLKNVTKLRHLNDYRQQLDNIFTTLSTCIPTPIPISRLRSIPKRRLVIRFPPTTIPRPRRTSEPLANNNTPTVSVEYKSE